MDSRRFMAMSAAVTLMLTSCACGKTDPQEKNSNSSSAVTEETTKKSKTTTTAEETAEEATTEETEASSKKIQLPRQNKKPRPHPSKKARLQQLQQLQPSLEQSPAKVRRAAVLHQEEETPHPPAEETTLRQAQTRCRHLLKCRRKANIQPR